MADVKGQGVMTGGAAPVEPGSALGQMRISRRLIAALVIVLGGILGSMPQSSPVVASGTVATVIADGAPLLAGSDDLTVIDTMEYGTAVDVLYGPYNGMYEILYYGVHGWTWEDKLDLGGGGGEATWSEASTSEPEVEAASASGPTEVSWWGSASWVVIDTDFLNVRSDAGTWADVWDTYPGGTWVAVVGNSVNGFAPISYGDGVAWISEQYISWDGATSYDNAAPSEGLGGTGGSATGTSGEERWIDVDRSSGAVTLYVGDVAQATYWGSLGYDPSPDGFFSTAVGSWTVTRKYKELAYTTYADAYITDWVAFDESRDNGFHSYMKDQYGNVLPWGAGATGGCVGLGPGAAEALFDFAFVGMRVEIHD
jgi:uncharacterized protein YgiM (DUF1202 family)